MLRSLVTIVVLVYLGFGLLIFLAQRSIMYHPVPERQTADMAAAYVESTDVRLKIWVVNPGRDSAVIYFGGNAEDVYTNAADFERVLPGHTVYLVNYRGYGGSSGSPSERNLFADALLVHAYASARHTQIDVVGRSLGSGVAIYLASERRIGRLVLVTPHDSAAAVARRLYPIYPVSLMLWDRYDSLAYAPKVQAPTLLVIAGGDKIIPYPHSSRLAAAFMPGIAEQVVIGAAGHNDLSLFTDYWRSIAKFLE